VKGDNVSRAEPASPEPGSDGLDDDFAAHALTADSDDHRWAFGTGFTDALEGVDTTVPPGVDAQALSVYCQMLGDDALILSHRLQQWMTRAPELEEETAIGNIALDLLGQARMLLARAGRADGTGRDEDAFAFWRAEQEFRNVRLVERVDADFAEMLARLLIFSTWRLAQFDALRGSTDQVLPPAGSSGSVTAPPNRTDGCRPRCRSSGRWSTSSSARTRSRLRSHGWPSTPPPCAPRWMSSSTPCWPPPVWHGRPPPGWPESVDATAEMVCTPKRSATS